MTGWHGEEKRREGKDKRSPTFIKDMKTQPAGTQESHHATFIAFEIAVRHVSGDLRSHLTSVANPLRTLNTAETYLPKNVLLY